MVEITGVVLREDSLTPVYGAVAYNKNSFLGTLTNKNGNFKMRIKKGDTLQITHLGFVKYLLVFEGLEFDKSQRIRIILRIKTYELQAVDVRAYRIRQKPAKEFTMRRTDNITIDGGRIRLDAGPYYYPPGGNNAPGMPGGVIWGIPFGNFREARRQVQVDKVARLEAIDNLRRYVSYKYNKRLVNQLTGLTGNELENFINFCKPSDKMVLEANDYDLAYFILDCYDKFITENE